MESSSIVFHDLGMFLSPPSFLKNTLTKYPQLTGLFFKHLKIYYVSSLCSPWILVKSAVILIVFSYR